LKGKGEWMLATCCWLMADGFLLLATDYWLLVQINCSFFSATKTQKHQNSQSISCLILDF